MAMSSEDRRVAEKLRSTMRMSGEHGFRLYETIQSRDRWEVFNRRVEDSRLLMKYFIKSNGYRLNDNEAEAFRYVMDSQ
ncbi:MAG TPA: hypothetical protein VJH90_02135 [archaeon]|nr:hypothetical protein [archaeon]